MGMTALPVNAVLVVCSANQARSPIAAALFRGQFARIMEQEKDHAWWPIHSAGVDAVQGMPLLPTMATVLARQGLEVVDHTSEVLTPEHVLGARLIVTMTEEHRHRVNAAEPSAVTRTFTLKELDRLMSSPWWRSGAPEVADPVNQLHALRPLVPPADRREDVADPALGSARLAQAVLEELVYLVGRVATELGRFRVVPGPNSKTSF